MPLADYDTSVEKIAALKVAMIDPALVQIKNGLIDKPYTVTEDIHIFYTDKLDQVIGVDRELFDSSVHTRPIHILMQSGEILDNFDTLMFIKDSDIVYSNPITTYQDRLATIYSTIGTNITSGTVTVGTNGSILLLSHLLQWTNNEYLARSAVNQPLPIPAGMQFNVNISGAIVKYFNVAADW